MENIEKIRVMLPHWIEHNQKHGQEYQKWAQLIKKDGKTEIASLLEKAGAILAEADAVLAEALLQLGGVLEDSKGHHQHD